MLGGRTCDRNQGGTASGPPHRPPQLTSSDMASWIAGALEKTAGVRADQTSAGGCQCSGVFKECGEQMTQCIGVTFRSGSFAFASFGPDRNPAQPAEPARPRLQATMTAAAVR